MAWKSVRYRLVGDAPLIMHNGQTADPLNEYYKRKARISRKSKKTDADHEEIAQIEMEAGLYVDTVGPYIPSDNIDAMLVAAAKKSKEGTLAKSGIYTKDKAYVEYDGPKDVISLVSDHRFRFSRLVCINRHRVPCTRPWFQQWAATVEVMFEDTLVNVENVDRWIAVASTQIGIGDWRPKYGRFCVTRE